jgi:hypothetical protein
MIPLLLEGQGSVNRVNGLITDQSGAVVPSAMVTAGELATNVTTVTKTNDQESNAAWLRAGKPKLISDPPVPATAPKGNSG